MRRLSASRARQWARRKGQGRLAVPPAEEQWSVVSALHFLQRFLRFLQIRRTQARENLDGATGEGAGLGQGFVLAQQGFGVVEALFTGLFAKFFGRLLPGKFDSFEQVGQKGGEVLHELGGEVRGCDAPFREPRREGSSAGDFGWVRTIPMPMRKRFEAVGLRFPASLPISGGNVQSTGHTCLLTAPTMT